MKRLAFVIPTLNCLHFTKQAILSINLRPGDRIFVIDNGSTDGTAEWLKEQPGVDLTEFGRNRGVATAWNHGLRRAFGEGFLHALVMNNDVVLAEDTIPALERGYARYGGIVSTHSVAALHALRHVDRRPTYALPVDYSCFMLSNEVFEQVGIFDEVFTPAYFEDQDFDCRAEQLGIPRGCLGDAVVCHFSSQTLRSGQLPNHTQDFERNRKRFMDRWGQYIRGGRHARRF